MYYKLKTGESGAAICDKGAELQSLFAGGREIMWEADPAFWGKTSPVLFPAVGNLRGDTALFGGVSPSESISVPLCKHGFARDNVFEAAQTSFGEAEFTLRYSEETRKHYPFKFVLKIKYNIFTDGIKITYTVINEDTKPMPFCLGAHPAFACPVEGYKLVFPQNETVFSPVMDTSDSLWNQDNRVKRLENENTFDLHYPLFDNDCVYFDTIKSKEVFLTENGTRGIKVAWEGFTSLGVWTPAKKNAPFVCIEPWCGSNDYKDEYGKFSEKRGAQTLNAGEKKEYIMIISVV